MSKQLDDFVIEFSSLLKERRRKLLNERFGIDAKRVKPFREHDRGEDRSGHLRMDRIAYRQRERQKCERSA